MHMNPILAFRMDPKNAPKTKSGQDLKTALPSGREHSSQTAGRPKMHPKNSHPKTYTKIKHDVIHGSQNNVKRAQIAPHPPNGSSSKGNCYPGVPSSVPRSPCTEF